MTAPPLILQRAATVQDLIILRRWGTFSFVFRVCIIQLLAMDCWHLVHENVVAGTRW
ncbi:MAG: hypothetical protein O2856_12305 [Planctomycetota bacterium]|nr:hypothetical protein [Planctomycetota bacterium]